MIKYLGQKYGMIKLLNFVTLSQSNSITDKKPIEKLIDFIRENKLILEHKLINLLNN